MSGLPSLPNPKAASPASGPLHLRAGEASPPPAPHSLREWGGQGRRAQLSSDAHTPTAGTRGPPRGRGWHPRPHPALPRARTPTPPAAARFLLTPGTRLAPAAQPRELRVSAARSGPAGAQPEMEAGEPREPREPGLGAETAAATATRWEEANAFCGNLTPKKKPKSVNTGPGRSGREGGRSRGRGRRPPAGGPVARLREGTQRLSTRVRPAVGAGSGLFWELCSVFLPGLGFHARTPLPHAAVRAQLRAPRPAPPGAAAWGARAALVAKPVREARGSHPDRRNQTLETRLLLAVRSDFCHPGTGLRTRAYAFWGQAQGQAPWAGALCSPRPEGAPRPLRPWFGASTLDSAPQLPSQWAFTPLLPPWWSQPSGTHVQERGPLPVPQVLMS